ncbi:mycothiol transferase [Desertihabitans aurantiacus]|uniref:mycothiol transferase n=1 Tax=Desertihabitans aurantiacus TaxID=2282477 RepID=UPI000DF7FA77|nr:DUF664 domain-containing protein [Desertihabitans aurantiacus]
MSGAANPGEPPPGLPGGEVEHLVAHLALLRGQVVEAVAALTPQQQRTAVLPSGWSPLELLSHLLHMERRWIRWGFLAEPVDEPWGDWGSAGSADPSETGGARWSVPEDVDAARLTTRLEEQARTTEEVLTGTPLDTLARTGGRFADGDTLPTLRWIAFHLLHEHSRHLGHLDAAVELLRDGRP